MRKLLVNEVTAGLKDRVLLVVRTQKRADILLGNFIDYLLCAGVEFKVDLVERCVTLVKTGGQVCLKAIDAVFTPSDHDVKWTAVEYSPDNLVVHYPKGIN
jgi:hypothetical protein